MNGNGTVKIGRWEYPAIRSSNGVTRNTKRDGSGDWVPAAPDRFVLDSSVEIDGFTADSEINLDYDELRTAYRFIFDTFATDRVELAEHMGVTEERTKALVRTLVHYNLVTEETRDVGNGPGPVAQCWRTYDELTAGEAMALFDSKVPADVRIRSSHGGKAGAQTKKPGRSTWAVGDPCPQGHTITEDSVYTMPSGRRQCKVCRSGYVSNGGAA